MTPRHYTDPRQARQAPPTAPPPPRQPATQSPPPATEPPRPAEQSPPQPTPAGQSAVQSPPPATRAPVRPTPAPSTAPPPQAPPPARRRPRTPNEIRADIEVTRAQLGDTIEALAHKTDVRAQAKERIAGGRAAVGDRAGKVGGAVRSNSAYVALGAVAAGLVVIALIRRRGSR